MIKIQPRVTNKYTGISMIHAVINYDYDKLILYYSNYWRSYKQVVSYIIYEFTLPLTYLLQPNGKSAVWVYFIS